LRSVRTTRVSRRSRTPTPRGRLAHLAGWRKKRLKKTKTKRAKKKIEIEVEDSARRVAESKRVKLRRAREPMRQVPMDHFTNFSSCSRSGDRDVLVEVVEVVANEGELEDGGEDGGSGADAEAKLMAHARVVVVMPRCVC
jgi:hypothetical protein